MDRISRLCFVALALAGPAGLHQVHGQWASVPAYDAVATGRWLWSAVLGVAWAVMGFALGLPDLPTNRRGALATAAAAYGAALGTVSLCQLVAGDPLLPRFVAAVAPGVLLPGSLICWNLAADGRGRGAQRDRVLLVAHPDTAAALWADLGGEVERPATIVGHLTPDDAVDGDRLAATAASTNATVLVLDTPAQASTAVVDQAAVLHGQGLRVRALSIFYEEWLGKLPLAELQRTSLLFDIGELHHRRYGRFKRILDVVAASAGLPLLAVLVPVVVVGNRMGNPGPLLFRQQRVGQNGQPFEILKLRTMITTEPAPGASPWTTTDDHRVTPFGRLLRRSHLDEVPQLLNILRGEVSIVGPRPEQVGHVQDLREKLPFYDARHLVRPGVTGWAQVKFGYAATESDALEKLQYDMFYLRRQSLTLDVCILARTLRSVLLRGGR